MNENVEVLLPLISKTPCHCDWLLVIFARGAKIPVNLFTLKSFKQIVESLALFGPLSVQKEQVGENPCCFIKPPFLFSTAPPLRTALGRLQRNLRGLKTLLQKKRTKLSLCSWHRLWRKGASVRGQRNIRTPVSLQLLRRMCTSAVDISRLVNHMLKYFLGIFKKMSHS